MEGFDDFWESRDTPVSIANGQRTIDFRSVIQKRVVLEAAKNTGMIRCIFKLDLLFIYSSIIHYRGVVEDIKRRRYVSNKCTTVRGKIGDEGVEADILFSKGSIKTHTKYSL